MKNIFVLFIVFLTACTANPVEPQTNISSLVLPKSDSVVFTMESPEQSCKRLGGHWLKSLRSVWTLVDGKVVHSMEAGCLYVVE